MSHKPIRVVYDMDGVLNYLNEHVFNKLGIPDKLDIIKRYSMRENAELGIITSEQARVINSLYREPEIFKEVHKLDGIERLMDIENRYKGIDSNIGSRISVSIYSQCLSKEIYEVKYAFVKAHIPTMPMDRVHLTTDTTKKAVDWATIIVEDSLENILRYDKEVVKVLIDKPYNKFENFEELREKIAEAGKIIRVGSLNEAIDVVEKVVASMLDE